MKHVLWGELRAAEAPTLLLYRYQRLDVAAAPVDTCARSLGLVREALRQGEALGRVLALEVVVQLRLLLSHKRQHGGELKARREARGNTGRTLAVMRNVVMQILHLRPVRSASILALDSAWFLFLASFIFLALLRSRLAADFCPLPPPMVLLTCSGC